MNYFLFALLSVLIVASSAAATRKQWSGNVKMQIKRQKAGATTSQGSDQAMQALNENVSDFLHNELVTLLGTEDAFSLGGVRGAVHGDSLSLNASFHCLDCGTAPDKDSIAQILMFLMQRRKDAWLPESDSAITEGCVDYEVAAAPAQPPLTFIEASTTTSGTKRPALAGRNFTTGVGRGTPSQLSYSKADMTS
jgi:hypothetical protein